MTVQYHQSGYLVSPGGTVLDPVQENTAELLAGHALQFGVVVVVRGLCEDRIHIHKVLLFSQA